MLKLISLALLWMASLPTYATPLLDRDVYELTKQRIAFQCDGCPAIAAAILTMRERLCSMPITEEAIQAIPSEPLFQQAKEELAQLPDTYFDDYILSLQRGANCMSSDAWLKETHFHFRRLTGENLSTSP